MIFQKTAAAARRDKVPERLRRRAPVHTNYFRARKSGIFKTVIAENDIVAPVKPVCEPGPVRRRKGVHLRQMFFKEKNLIPCRAVAKERNRFSPQCNFPRKPLAERRFTRPAR